MDTYINGFGPAIRGTLAVETFPDYKEIAAKRKSSFKRWEKSIIEEKGKRTTFIYKKKYIDFMYKDWGSMGGNWHKGTDSGYSTNMLRQVPDYFSLAANRPRGILVNTRGVVSAVK